MNPTSPSSYDYYDDSSDLSTDGRSKKSGGKYQPTNQELGKQCTEAMTSFFEHADFRKCRKLGSWTRRANGLVGQITTMMFLCMNGDNGKVNTS